jgi:hypothetical protein
MIPAHDVRIGNWFHSHGNGLTQIISGNDIDKALLQQYEPVAIDEEVLLALGFAKRGGSEIYEIKHNNFAYHLGVKRVAIYHPGNALWHWLGTHINYLHQIQNLFYCIVGYDLTLKMQKGYKSLSKEAELLK